MKKITSLLLLLICVIAVSSCHNQDNGNNNQEVIDNQKEVDEFKMLLNQQDLSPFYERMFSAMFRQDYVSYINSYDVEERSIDFFKYIGTGAYGYYYSATQEEYEEIMAKGNANPFDFIMKGPGNYSLIQSAKINSITSELVDGIEKASTRDLTYHQNLNALFDYTDLQLYNWFEVKEGDDDTPYSSTEFNGIVNKEVLIEVVSTQWLTDTIQRVCAFDGQKNTEFIDGLYYKVCQSLVNKTDKEISDFIKTNKIVISEGEEYTELSFELNDESIKQSLIDNDIFPGSFTGTLYYDKESGSFEKYLYEISYMDNTVDEEDACIFSTTLRFTATGYSYHQTFERVPYIQPNPVVYDDAYEFVNDMAENIIPQID